MSVDEFKRFVPPEPTPASNLAALTTDLLAWAQPSVPFVVAVSDDGVAGAAGVTELRRWHPVIAPIMGHPIDVLRWVPNPERWDVIGIVTAGCARTLDTADRDAPDGIPVRVALVSTRRASFSTIRYPNGKDIACPNPTGRLVDACIATLTAAHPST